MPDETFVPPNEGVEATPDAAETTAPNPGREAAETRAGMLEEMAAVRKAFAEKAKADTTATPPAGAGTDASAPAAGSSPEPAKDAPAPPAVDPTEAAIQKAMAEREAVFERRLAAEREAERIIGEARAKAAAAFEAEKAELRRKAMADPSAFVKESGWNPVEFMQNLAADGTPTSTLQRQLMLQAQELAELKAWKQSEAESRAKADAAAQTQKHEEVGKQFVNFAATEARPTLKSLMAKPTIARALVQEVSAEADRRMAATGKAPAWDDLADWLERSYAPPQATPEAAPPKAAPPTAGKSSNAARAPSQAQASERRAVAKEWDEMSPAEQKKLVLEDMANVRARYASGNVKDDD